MKKPTILYITELFPYPPDSGAKIKTINTIQTLSKKFNIVLISFSEQKIAKIDQAIIKRCVLFQKNFLLPNLSVAPQKNIKKLLSNYLKLKPHFLCQFYSAEAKVFIEQIIQKVQPNAIHIDHLTMAQYLPKSKNELWIYEEHNIESDLAKSRYLSYAGINKTKIHLLIEYLLIYFQEQILIKKFDAIFAISKTDLTKLFNFAQNKSKLFLQKIVYLPSKYSPPIMNKPPELLFLGDMTWHPNQQAINWFFGEIWPKVKKLEPAIKLNLVGRIEPQEKIKFAVDKNIIVWGYQKNLVPFLNSSFISILPFKVGGGVRLKALSAMSAKQPIVSTGIGVMGLNLDQGEFLLADDPIDFAAKCAHLFKNRQAAKNQASLAFKKLLLEHGQKNNQIYLFEYESLF